MGVTELQPPGPPVAPRRWDRGPEQISRRSLQEELTLPHLDLGLPAPTTMKP